MWYLTLSPSRCRPTPGCGTSTPIFSDASRFGMVNVEWIQQYVSITLPGTPSTMQSIGSPMYWREVTTSEKAIRTMTVAL